MKPMNRAEPMTPQEATLAFALAIVLLLGVSPFAAPLGIGGVALIQLVAFATPAVAIAWRSGGSARAAWKMLGLTRPRARHVVGACLVGASFWYLNLITMVRASQWLVDGKAELDQLGRAMFAGGESTWIIVAIIAITPAVCEELLLRGAVARALDARRGRATAIVVSALVFGLLHMSMVRLMPTAAFGVVLAYAALTSGSLVASMVIHLVNNAIAVALASGALPEVVSLLTDYPKSTTAVAAASCGLGLYLLATDRSEAGSVS